MRFPPIGAPTSDGAKEEALLRQLFHELIKALVQPAEQGRLWHAAVLKKEFGCVLGFEPNFLEVLALGVAGGV
jgi:hypothetical protein